jgi:hypothetical protein
MMKTVAIVLAGAWVFAAAAQDKACSPADMQRAQKAVDNVVTWQQLTKAWKDWRQCDTGEVADTYTDALMRLLVEWKNIDAFADAMKDAQYQAFVESHLHSPAAKDDVASVRSRATQSCPKAHDALCKQIAAATEGAKPMDLSPMAPLVVPAAAPK